MNTPEQDNADQEALLSMQALIETLRSKLDEFMKQDYPINTENSVLENKLFRDIIDLGNDIMQAQLNVKLGSNNSELVNSLISMLTNPNVPVKVVPPKQNLFSGKYPFSQN